MSELSEFLLLRIAEDEAVAKATPGQGAWFLGHDRKPGQTAAVDQATALVAAESTASEWTRHIVAWDPARVLAECEAKRRIIDVHKPLDNDPEPFCWNCDEDTWPCKTMAALALPHADHADYDERWRP